LEAGDLDSVEPKRAIFPCRRGHYVEVNAVKFALAAIKRGLVTTAIGKLDHLYSPFSEGGILGYRYADLERWLEEVGIPDEQPAASQLDLVGASHAELKTLD
jgi:hypothetical protein